MATRPPGLPHAKKLSRSSTSSLGMVELGPASPRSSADLIYEVVMRGGGEPFGAPWELGPASLTDKRAKQLNQRGYSAFETLERPETLGRNRFTRYGASRYLGRYRKRRRGER